MKIAKNKREVQNYSKGNEHWEYGRDLLNELYKFLVDIGANRELPEDKPALKQYLIRLHETIAIKNGMFPLYSPFLDIYKAWMSDVVYGKIGRNGNNISALVRCFNEWYKINAATWINNGSPDLQVERASGKGPSGKRVEEMDDDQLVSLLQTLEKIGGSDMKSLFNTTGSESFTNRVLEECKKRGLVKT